MGLHNQKTPSPKHGDLRITKNKATDVYRIEKYFYAGWEARNKVTFPTLDRAKAALIIQELEDQRNKDARTWEVVPTSEGNIL